MSSASVLKNIPILIDPLLLFQLWLCSSTSLYDISLSRNVFGADGKFFTNCLLNVDLQAYTINLMPENQKMWQIYGCCEASDLSSGSVNL